MSKVYDELRRKAPDSLRYATLMAGDGVTFFHLASIETADGSNPLARTDAFKAFQADLATRCDEPPAATELTEIGSYRLLSGLSGPEVVHEDRWGSVVDRPLAGVIELRWFDSTAEMEGDDFKASLTRLAGALEHRPGRGVLVDATSFRMDPRHMDAAWRDASIIPRYNAARVRRFAFHMPAGAPTIGRPPAREEPGSFPTAYFGTRRDALDWLAAT